MKIAYLYFAYKNPELMRRTIARLSNHECDFFIHIDANSDIGDFTKLQSDSVYFTNTRLQVQWAQFSGVEAVLLLIERALERANYDYFVLLSGSEFPLKGREYIHRFLNANRGAEFINLVKVPNLLAGKPASRINTLWLPSKRPLLRYSIRFLTKMGLGQRDFRKYLGSLEPYAGNTWWALTADACQYVDKFARNSPGCVQFFQNTFAPEETFIHTILGNSPFRRRVRRNLVFEDWHDRGANPAMITNAHIETIASKERIILNDIYGCAEALFARKFSDATLATVDLLEDATR